MPRVGGADPSRDEEVLSVGGDQENTGASSLGTVGEDEESDQRPAEEEEDARYADQSCKARLDTIARFSYARAG